jgi:hypothetical protein
MFRCKTAARLACVARSARLDHAAACAQATLECGAYQAAGCGMRLLILLTCCEAYAVELQALVLLAMAALVLSPTQRWHPRVVRGRWLVVVFMSLWKRVLICRMVLLHMRLLTIGGCGPCDRSSFVGSKP